MPELPKKDISPVAQVLGTGGLFEKKLSGFQPRTSQVQLAEAITRCIDEQGTLMAEAGTGTGKTFAYLVPALLSQNKKITVSTGTKNLQQQLFDRDLPQVARLLGVNLRLRLLKGRENYFCSYRFNLARCGSAGKDSRFATSVRIIDPWLRQTSEGDLSELTGLPEDSPVWSHLYATSDNCLGGDCPEQEGCYVMRARRRAQKADVLVVNHHLLFADMSLKRGGVHDLLPTADVVIFDEAHQIPATASQFFSESLTARQCQYLIDDSKRATGDAGVFTTVQESLEALDQALRDVRLKLNTSLNSGDVNGTRQNMLSVSGVKDVLSRLADGLFDVKQSLETVADVSPELKLLLERACKMHGFLASWLKARCDKVVYWYEIRNRHFALHHTPLDVSGPLQEFRKSMPAAWIMTSATLSVGGNFKHFKRATGLHDAATVQLDSPFDYENQALLYLPENMPNPSDRNYQRSVLDKALPVIQACAGGVFFLFTSHAALRNAARWLAGNLGDRPLFVQGDAPRHRLLDDFRQAGNGVLLGAASFWEGVDVAGDDLSCVIIDRLPFACPDDPVLQARLQHIKESGGRPFWGYQLPSAAIALKQGAGRLIRSGRDRGVLMLCDPRVLTKPYGGVLLRALPGMRQSRLQSEVEAFFSGLAKW